MLKLQKKKCGSVPVSSEKGMPDNCQTDNLTDMGRGMSHSSFWYYTTLEQKTASNPKMLVWFLSLKARDSPLLHDVRGHLHFFSPLDFIGAPDLRSNSACRRAPVYQRRRKKLSNWLALVWLEHLIWTAFVSLNVTRPCRIKKISGTAWNLLCPTSEENFPNY